MLIIVDASSVSVLEGHTNCIWGLSVPGTQQALLASAAADGTVKIWDTRLHSRSPLRASFRYAEDEKVNPTCVTWDWEGRGIIIGWENASVELWDVERSAATMKLVSNDATGNELWRSFTNLDIGKSTQVNCIAKYPAEQLIVAGYEDRNIRIFDARTGNFPHYLKHF
jgi:WD40 repeat protein